MSRDDARAASFDAPLAPWQQRAYDHAATAIEAGRLGRAVTLDENIDGRADGFLREIDEMLGLLNKATV